MFLLNQNNRANWVLKFKCPADTAIHGSLLSNKTYYNTLNDLQKFGLIEVEKGINNFRAAKITIKKLKYSDENDFIQQPEIQSPEQSSSVTTTPQLTPQLTQLLTQLSTPQLTLLTTQLSTLLPTLKDIHKTIIHITIKQKTKNSDLFFPFTSEIFLKTWEILKNEPKWKNKSQNAYQMSLNKLGKYSEQTAIEMMQKSIESGWQGLFELNESSKNKNAITAEIPKIYDTTKTKFE
jgi:hypothetical protein